MNTLVIITRFPRTVAALLKTHELVEQAPSVRREEATLDLEVPYLDDGISQSLAFWFALALGCGLIIDYHLLTPRMMKEETARKEAGKDERGKEAEGKNR